MSRSRRRALERAVDVVWRLDGPAAARLFMDEQRTGVRCPSCKGERVVTWTEKTGLPITHEPCSLCRGQGALRPRTGPRADIIRVTHDKLVRAARGIEAPFVYTAQQARPLKAMKAPKLMEWRPDEYQAVDVVRHVVGLDLGARPDETMIFHVMKNRTP